MEKIKLNQDLEYKKKELASNMMYLMEKNEFITAISKKLIELKPDAKKDNKDLIQQIINEIRQNSTTKIWDEFEIRFKEVHERFYKELHKAHPDLTPNEIDRLLSSELIGRSGCYRDNNKIFVRLVDVFQTSCCSKALLHHYYNILISLFTRTLIRLSKKSKGSAVASTGTTETETIATCQQTFFFKKVTRCL